MMRGGTLFSGIGAPECAAPGIDWRWAAEIDPFASAVHAARFPGVRNLGDITQVDWHAVEPVDLVVGGPPCQDYSVAGQRASLAGPRGDLTLQYARILDAIDPAWSVTENVPGWLSTPDNAFGTFLGILVGADAALVPGIGQQWTDSGVVAGPRRTAAWRILDAQYFGVPQRRRRVFVVACRGAGNFACAEALFPLRESLRRDIAPRRATGQSVTPILEAGARTGKSTDDPRAGIGIGAPGDPMFSLQAGKQHAIANPLGAKRDGGWRGDLDNDTFVTVGTLQSGGTPNGHGTADINRQAVNAGHIVPVMTLAIRGRGDSHDLEYRDDGIANAVLQPGGGRAGIGVGAVAFHQNVRSEVRVTEVMGALNTGGGKPGQGYPAIAIPLQYAEQLGREKRQNGMGLGDNGDPMYTLETRQAHGVAFAQNQQGEIREMPYSGALKAEHGMNETSYIRNAMSVRRLTPVECERLQGFPDGWTDVAYRGKQAADGPRYRAVGNSMAVPCIGWVLSRVQQVAAASLEEAA